MYRIGEFSKLCRVSVNTLRYYDSEGLLSPDYTDKYTGYRYYSGESLSRFHMISALKSAGFSLEEIKTILKSGDKLENVIEKRERELRSQLSELNDRLSMLSAIKNALEKEGHRMFGVTIKEGFCYNAVTVRRLLDSRTETTQIIDEIKAYLHSNAIPHGNPLIINYELEHQETNLDLAVGVIIFGKLPKNCPYTEKTIVIKSSAADVACSGQELDSAYSALLEYTGSLGYQLTGPYYEIYHDDSTVEVIVPVHKLSPRSTEPRNDNIDLPFQNDPQVIGRWELLDCLNYKEQFNRNKLKNTGGRVIPSICFLPGGQRYWIFGWTKDYLLTFSGYPKCQNANRYDLEVIDGERYMFVEMKWGPYAFHDGLPEIWVLRQVDQRAYSKQDLRIKDATNLPFVGDDQVVGKWAVCDLVDEIVHFDPDALNATYPKDGLFWRTVEFVPDGSCKIAYGDGTAYEQPDYTWTKDFILAHISYVAEKYVVRRVKAADYLFIEWKSGDYSFGGKKPAYYVFRRTE